MKTLLSCCQVEIDIEAILKPFFIEFPTEFYNRFLSRPYPIQIFEIEIKIGPYLAQYLM